MNAQRLLNPAQVTRAQQLAAQRLDARAIACLLEVPEDLVLRTFRATPADRSADLDVVHAAGFDDLEPLPLRTVRAPGEHGRVRIHHRPGA